MDFVGSPTALRRWAVASLVGNMAIVVTGGLVRLTGSGLGCSSWPQCEPGSYVPPEPTLHASIEFGNRLLTFVLIMIAIATFVTAWKARDAAGAPRRTLRRLALVAALGIPAQAVIGGVSVLVALNPWWVGLHLVVSIGLIVVCVVLVHAAFDRQPLPMRPVARLLARITFGVGLLALLLGMVVTGAGPHAGDADAPRNGLDLATVARVHALAVSAVVGLTIALVVVTMGNQAVQRAVWVLLAVELAQAAVGYVQYFLGLPAAVVALHVLGATLFAAALAHLWWTSRHSPTELSEPQPVRAGSDSDKSGIGRAES
jgi:cytochrome c oxidase assembly protein subunit 15